MRQGIACVPPMRMLVDLGAVVDEAEVVAALDDVLTQRLVPFDGIRRGLYRHARSGHNGITALRRALEAWQIGDRPADSKLETRMSDLLREFGLPPAEFHATVCGYEVDFVITGTRVVLECDGYVAHGLDRDQFEFDRVRNGELTGAGRVIVHFTWRQVTQAPDGVARRIERNLQEWAPEVLAAHRARR